MSPLHIKLELVKQFVKALNKEGKTFKYICQKQKFKCFHMLKSQESEDKNNIIGDCLEK